MEGLRIGYGQVTRKSGEGREFHFALTLPPMSVTTSLLSYQMRARIELV